KIRKDSAKPPKATFFCRTTATPSGIATSRFASSSNGYRFGCARPKNCEFVMFDRNFLDPELSLAGKCHTCNEQILFEQEFCPQCGINIDHEHMAVGVVNNFLLTQAVSSANTIRTLDVGAYIFLGASVFRFMLDFPLWFDVVTSLFWVTPMIIIGRWF